MNRLSRPLLACGLGLLMVGLLAVLLTLPAGTAVGLAGSWLAACEPSSRLRVPDDCPTIQAALDVILDGGEIDVRETTDDASTYRENLAITRSVVLWGGWDEAFNEASGDSTLDAQHLGRGITISSTEEIAVVIRQMTIVSGTATGLGGLTESAAFEISQGYTGTTVAADAPPFRGLAGDDCGGGIYARNAHLRLYDVRGRDNIASTTGRGFGGGVCAVDVPYKDPTEMQEPFAPGLWVEEGSEIADNIASTAAEGAGGGVFVAHAVGNVLVQGSGISHNVGSTVASAYGGGMFGVNLETYFITKAELNGNIATRSAEAAHFGRGGGVATVEVTEGHLSSNTFSGNIAATATRGYGGGLYVRQSFQGIDVRDGEFVGNQASAADSQAGYGGGLMLEDILASDNNFVRFNQFRDNIGAAGGQGGGGGLLIANAPEVKFFGNRLLANQAVVSATHGASFGGGMALVNSFHPWLESNHILGNTAAGGGTATAVHRGGGLYLSHTDELLIDENEIITNTAALDLPGEGGGLYLEESASGQRAVRVWDNLLDGNIASQGGGMVVRGSTEALVRHNHFVGNAASGAHAVGANAGGGLLVDQTTGAALNITVDRNHFLRNTVGPTGTLGGGAALMGVSTFTLVNNVFAGNEGAAAAGLYLLTHATTQETNEAANNTFTANDGPAIGVQGWNDPPFTFYNTIIADGAVGVQVPAGTTVTLDYTLWHNTPTRGTGGGTLNDLHPVRGDPAFVDVAKDDYHLRKTSAARDAGDPAGIPPAPEVDLASAMRPFGERVDIGAYEWRDAVHWPNDYALLQEAIEAARPGDGDTILALGQGFGGTEEQIHVTKSITLSGGWDREFQGRDPHGPTIWLNQPHVPGRFLTIEGGPGVVVKIEGFSFDSGDASGLGGLPAARAAAQAGRSASTLSAKASGAASAAAPAAASSAALYDTVARLQADGWLPTEAAAAVETLLGRLDEAAKQAAEAPASATALADADCGGAIYSQGAGLYLSESYFQKNIASKSGEGYGGALCVLDAPAGQLVVRDVEMRYNIGSLQGQGLGGAIYIAGSPQAELDGLHLYLNIASAQGSGGSGGGLLVTESDGLVVRNSQIDSNIAVGLWGAEFGTGGGAEIWQSQGARIVDNVFRGNLGGPMCAMCRGGGLNLGRGQDMHIAGNEFEYNVAGFAEWPAGMNGGGLSLDAVGASQVLSNTFTNNSAGVGGSEGNTGGGLYGIALNDVLFAGNTLTGNWASQVGPGHGGGAFFEPSMHAASERLTFRDNHFTGNAGSLSGAEYTMMAGGGGLELFLTTDSTVRGNRFEGNRAAYDLAGLGGGLLLRSSVGELGGGKTAIDVVVDGNLFAGNAADVGESVGGGLAASGVQEYTVVNNVFAGNRAAYGGGLSMDVADSTEGAFSATVVNNTLYNNTASGLCLYGENSDAFVITNTVLVSHTVGVSVPGDDTHIALAYTLWNDVEQRTDNPDMVEDRHPITGLVNFVDQAAGNFRLRVDSAARDAGDPDGVPPAPDHDADGMRRPFGPRVDVGAYEWHGTLIYLPLVCKRN